MTKVMKLNVSYYGYYGGNVDETVLLPLDINGVLFEELQEGTYEQVVYLGEIEGKHSECYGDLTVKFIDLDTLSLIETTKLIESSNYSQFDCYFDGTESEYSYSDNNVGEDKIKEVLDKYGLDYKDYYVNTESVYKVFIEQLKEKYIKKFKTITVLEEDYEYAISVLLKNSNIKIYE